MRTTLAALVTFVSFANAWGPLLAADPESRRGDRGPALATATAPPKSEAPDSQSSFMPLERKTETAVFAGGCFWCTELAFEQLRGVLDVESGYCGGTRNTASYERVHRGTTNHAEAIRVTYDPKKISYDQLLAVFFDAHDPTQFNRQGPDDVGRHYRSAIFFANSQQKTQAEAKIQELRQRRVYSRRIVTRLEPLEAFYPAEGYHQNFALMNPLLPYIQTHAVPRACNVRDLHPELIDPAK